MSALMADTASQQLIASQGTGSKPPADVFFGLSKSRLGADQGGVVANLPPVAVVPEAKDLDKEAAVSALSSSSMAERS